MATAESPQTDAPKKKKSLFRRTVPRKKPTDPNSESHELVGTEKSQEEFNDLDFFKRSKDVFPMVLQEVLEEKAPSPEKHDRKRRKVSIEPGSATTSTRKLTPTMSGSSEGRRKSSSVRLESDSDSDIIMDVKGKGKEIVRANKLLTARMLFSSPSKRAIVQIGDDDDSDDDDDGDEELAVLQVQRSRNMTPGRRTRQSTRQLNRDSSPVAVIDEDINSETFARDSSELEEIPPPEEDDQLDDEFSIWVTKAQEREAKQNPDAIIQMFVTSKLAGSIPLAFARNLKRNLKIVLDTWVDHQRNAANFDISKEEASKMFLTWKGNKIYGESTPASLGVQVTEGGELKGGVGEGYWKGKLHLEAWTEEDYAAWLEYKERERALQLGLFEDNEYGSEAEFEEHNQPPPAKKKGVKVILKAKEFDALNTTVRDDTTVEMLISVFRAQRGVGLERSMEIWLDGERLEEESLVKDADIDPDEPNQLEVHIR